MWDGGEHFFEGTVEGTIRHERSGVAGFGYDPIFEPDGYDITFAEMDMDEKNAISHRGRAVEKLVNFLNTQTG
jgi:XTP/dITP diphosphohydrolase